MKRTAQEKSRKNRLLAKVHIIKKEALNNDEALYRGILEREFGKRSARDCTELELSYLIEYFREHGWSPEAGGRRSEVKEKQIVTLRARAREIASGIENGERRLQGLIKKCCGVERLEWCRDPGALKRVLAALEGISKQ